MKAADLTPEEREQRRLDRAKYYQDHKEHEDKQNKKYQREHLKEHAERCKKFKELKPGRAQQASRKWTRRDWAPGEHERAEKLFPTITKCGCCESPDARNKLGWRADHNHLTGMFRSYLCHPCNIIIGFIEKYKLNCGTMYETYIKSHEGVTP